ncbi:hypothetical protein [Nocardioides sp.]|uniref:hypothetical protein n=1 Tax=Nocardioides sp. TaxID=35761 RepID=UPI0031FE7DC5|nr:hypothetical protein [Nocardioides sp.]
MRTPLRILGALTATTVAAVAIPLLSSTDAQAVRFTGGNLVVYRVGTGSGVLTNAAAPVFLDEYTPSGTKVQSIALPTVAADGNQPLTAAGQSQSEGLLSNSPDGHYVALTGYAAAPGATGPAGASLTASDPTSVGRVVGLVDANGVADTSIVLNSAGTAKIIRSAATLNGDRIWATGGNGGIVTTTLGSATVSTVAGTDASNLNALSVQGDQLFASGILANRLAKVGSGTPSGSASLSDLTGLPDNLLTFGYAFLDLTAADYSGTGFDTLYVANASERGGAVDKYRFSGSTWTLAGSAAVEGATGLVADIDGAAVSLAVTTPAKLIAINDPAGSGTTFTPATPITLATAPANTEFRGVALAPTSAPGPSVYVRTPGAGDTVDLGTSTIPVKAYIDGPASISEAKVKIGGGSFVNATKGSGHLWTANVPTGGLSAGTTTLTVAATDANGTTNAVRSIKLTGQSANTLVAGKYAWTNAKVTRTGTWRNYAAPTAPGKKGITSKTKGDTATASFSGGKLVITFGTSPKAGKVKVKVDGKSTTLDLYKAAVGTLTKTFTVSGSGTHSVKVTVLGTKNAKSKGAAVFLAVLQVK